MSLYDELAKAEKNENNPDLFSKLLLKNAIEKSFLTHCTFELTPFCNFLCKFCYARKDPQEYSKKGVALFRFQEWKKCIDELAEMQCPYLIITGGECTLHPDFAQIYAYAYDRGLTISVFTNGSRFTEELFDLFQKKPPYRIYITVYGNSPDMYEKVTGKPHWHDIVKSNIRRLAMVNHDVIVQGTFTEENLADMEAIYDFAAELGLEYRYSTQLQTFGHCTSDVQESMQVDRELEKKLRQNIQNKKYGVSQQNDETVHKRTFIPKKAPFEPKGITCNAGQCTCVINAEGYMTACNVFDAFKVDTKDRSIKECFAELNHWVRNIPRIEECQGCPHIVHCVTCVAAHYNDTHQLGVPSPRLCYKIREPEKAAAERAFYEEHGYIEI